MRATVEDLAPYMTREAVEEILGVLLARLARANVRAEDCRATFSVVAVRGRYAGTEWDPDLPAGRGRRLLGNRVLSSAS